MLDGAPRYSFDPLERRGLLLGLQASQIAVAAAGLLAAWMAIRVLAGPAGPALALGSVLAAGVGTFWTKDGKTAASWADLTLRWSLRRLRGPLVSGEPLDGHRLNGIRPVVGARATGGRMSANALLGVELAALQAELGQPPVGVVIDRASGNWVAVLPVRGRSFALLDAEDQARRLDSWRVVLNSIGRPGTRVRRVQWIERSWCASNSELLETARSIEPAERRCHEAVSSYADVISGAASAAQMHEVYMAVAVAGPRTVSGEAGRRASDTIRRELRLLEGQLRNGELWTSAPLGAHEIAGLVESAHSEQPTARRTGSRQSFRAIAEDEGWSCLRAGGTWHATYWVAEWPRIEVGPDFMSPLLMSGGRRSVSLTMAPVPSDRAARQVRSARTADVAEEQLRARAGFVPNARRDKEAESVVRREEELAVGHAEYRFSGYVTVSASDRAELDLACAETEHAAQAAHLEIRRLYGRQREAFTFTLPLARGLR